MTCCRHSELGKATKILSIVLTVEVAYVGPEPSMTIRPFSKAWSITCEDSEEEKMSYFNTKIMCHGKMRLYTNYEMPKYHKLCQQPVILNFELKTRILKN
jgi:hypothetical protein